MICMLLFLLSITASFAAETDDAISDKNITSNTLSTQISVDEIKESDMESLTYDNELSAADDGAEDKSDNESQNNDNELSIADDGAEDDNDDVLGTVSDGSEDILKDTGTFQEIVTKISQAGDAGTIQLEDITYSRSGYTNYIEIKQRITIDGNGAVIDGDGASQMIFWVNTGSKVIFKNMTIQNSKSHAVYFTTTSNFEFIDCTIKDNAYSATSSIGGAAIYFAGSIITGSKFKNVIFENNQVTRTSTVYGGALYFASGATYVDFENVTFRKNSISTSSNSGYYYGAAIYFATTASNIKFTNVTFDENEIKSTTSSSNMYFRGAAIYFGGVNENNVFTIVNFTGNKLTSNSKASNMLGGAIYYYGAPNNSNFINCTFDDNYAYSGGAIYVYPSAPENVNKFINTTFKNNNAYNYGGALYLSNVATSMEFKNVNFTNNSATYRGGAIYSITLSKFDNANFSENKVTESATGNGGGAIFVNTDITAGTLKNVNFTKNTAYYGGAVYFYSKVSGVSFDNVNFTENRANNYGGAFWFNNIVSGVSFDNVNFIKNSASYHGGAFWFNNIVSGVSFDNVNFTENRANNYGGAIYFVNTASTISFNNVDFTKNTAGSRAGAIYFTTLGDSNQWNDVNFIGNNVTSGNGGAIYINSNSFSRLEGMQFINNTASSYGGAIYINSAVSNKIFSNLNFTGNHANTGGAIYFYYNQISQNTFENMNFNNNTASNQAAAIFFGGTVNDNEFNNINFTKNSAVNAGLIYFSSSVYRNNFIKTNLFNNSANSNGLIYISSLSSNTNTFEYSIFENNTAYSIYSYSRVNLNYCNFTNNNNGVYIAGSSAYDNTVSNSIFKNNTGYILHSTYGRFNVEDSVFNANPGTSIYLPGGSASISNTNFTNNKGRSIHQSGTPTTEISGSRFINNTFDGDGCVIYSINSHSNMISDSVFENNSATGNGVIYSEYAVYLNNVNMTNNSAKNGGALYVGGAESQIINSNFKINNADVYGGAVFVAKGNVNIESTAFEQNTAETGGAIYISTLSQGTINQASFKSNRAFRGSAICYNGDNAFTISNSEFLENKANSTQLYLFFDKFKNKIAVRYTAGDNYINAISSNSDLTFENVTYYDYGNGIVNTDNVAPIKTYNIANQSITLEIYDENGLVETIQFTTQGTEFIMDYDAGVKHLFASRADDAYYTYINGSYDYAWGDFDELQSLIINTTDGKLDLTRNFTYIIGVDTITEGIFIDKEIIIDGHGYTINALFQSRVFDLYSDNIKFYNIRFVNATGLDGSFIHGVDVNGTVVENCTFESYPPLADIGGEVPDVSPGTSISLDPNTGTSLGGDSTTLGGDLIEEPKVPITTEITYFGYNGNAIYIIGDNLYIKNSNFTNLMADYGGSVYFEGNNLLIDDSIFNMTTAHYGGAIWANGTDIKVYNSHFNFTIAGFAGGAIQAFGTDHYIVNSTFDLSFADGIIDVVSNVEDPYGFGFVSPSTIHELIFINTHAYGGGAINEHADNLNIINTTFYGCSVEESIGGAVYSNGTTNIIGSNFTFSSAGFGGAIFLDTGAVDSVIDDCVFKDLLYEYYGGAVLTLAENTLVQYSLFNNITMMGSEFSGFAYSGGAVAIASNNSRVLYSNFTNNTASSQYSNSILFISPISIHTMDIFDENMRMNGLIDHCIFEKNYGSAVGVYASNITVQNSSFKDNQAERGVLMHMGTDLKVIDSNFTHNLGKENYGMAYGIVVLMSNNDTIRGCTFDSNKGEMYGSVVVMDMAILGYGSSADYPFGNTTIDECTFINNGAQIAGAVMMGGNGGSIKNSKFDNNSALLAGAVYLASNNVEITDSNFTNNLAVAGGAVIVGDYSLVWVIMSNIGGENYGVVYEGSYNENNSIINSNFINNTADFAPGVLWLDNYGLIQNSTFRNNYFDKFTGEDFFNINIDILLTSEDLSEYDEETLEYLIAMAKMYLVEEYEYQLDAVRYELQEYFTQATGSAIHWVGDEGTVNNCTFEDNNASTLKYDDYGLNMTVIFKNELYNFHYYKAMSLMEYLEETYYDDYLKFIDVNGYDPGLESWLFNNIYGFINVYNLHDDTGEFVYDLYRFEGIDNANYYGSDNYYAYYALYKPYYEYEDEYGQIIGYYENIQVYSERGELYVIYEIVETESHVSSQGGAIFWQGANGLVNDTVFINNSADDGGAIFAAIYDYESPFYVNNSRFINNSANIGGGAIVMNGNNIIVENSEFTGNTAVYNPPLSIIILSEEEFSQLTPESYDELINQGYDYVLPMNNIITSSGGGAILWIGENGIIRNSNFTRNTADYGGAIVFYGLNIEDVEYSLSTNSTVIDCNFDNNTAKYGGAIDWMGDDGKLINSTFTNNTAEYAGAVLVEGVNMQIQANFTNNTASTGGALIILETGEVYNSNFTSNTANQGGAIYIIADNVKVTSSEFINNSADNGGAIYINADNVEVISSVFIKNNAFEGGAIYWMGNDGTVAESKFFNNTATHGGALYYIGEGQNIQNSEFKYNKAEGGSAVYTQNSLNIKSSIFLENQAKASSLTFTYDIVENNVTVNAIFTGEDNFINAIYTLSRCNVENVTYWTHDGLTNTDTAAPIMTSLEDGINITLELYDTAFNTITTINITNVNGEARLFLPNNKNGRYFMVIKHYEDNYYTEISNEVMIQIQKIDPTIGVGVSGIKVEDIYYSENATVTVTLPSDATGNITFEIDGVNVTTMNLTEGVAVLNKSGLEGGVHNLTVYYSGDEYYSANSTATRFTVKPIPSTVNITTEGGNYKDNITVNVTVEENAKGFVIITIEDEFGHTLQINDTNELTTVINTLKAGEYNVTAYYSGDNNYLSSTNKTLLVVNPIDLNPVVSATNVTVAENTTFTLNVPDDFVGYVNITVGDVSKVYHIAGSTQITFVNLPVGNKTANVTFYGDRNYNNATVYPVNFTVSEVPQVIQTMTVNITDTTYPYGSVAQVTVSNNLNGTAVIIVDDRPFTVTITNGTGSVEITGLTAGMKTAQANFTSTDEMHNLTATDKFMVNKAASKIDIRIEDHDVIVNVTPGATGNVTFYVDGEKQVIELNNSVAVWKNILRTGYNNTIVVVYEGDVNYTVSENNTDIFINKLESYVNVTANTTVYGNDAIITVNAPLAQTGYVTITVNDENYTRQLSNGVAVFNIPKLAVNEYMVNVTYMGDEKYDTRGNSTRFNVIKANLTASVIGLNITVNDNSSFIISNVPSDFKGKVNITVDGFTYSGNVTTLINMEKLVEGNKTAQIVFWNDSNYNRLDLTADFTVSTINPTATTINITVNDVTYPEKATANITVSGNANGTVIVTVDGNELPETTITNGFISIDLGVLSAGVKDISVNFTATDNVSTNATANTKFTVNKAKSKIDIRIEGHDVIVNVTQGATGNVTFYVDGEKQVIELVNSIAVWENILRIGYNNTVVVVYQGDVNYTESENYTDIYIDRLESLVNATANNTVYGNDAVITVTVPTNQTGYVTIQVNNNNYTQILKDGKAVFNIKGLTVNEYPVIVTYLGDANYTMQTNETAFNVTPAKLNVTVMAENITVLQNGTFLISHITDGFTGKVNITVDSVTYTRDIDSLINIPALHAGNKTATVVFWNDNNYEELTLTVDFTVSRIPTTVTVTVEDVTYPETAKAIVNVSGKANGTVIITIDGKDFSGTVVNGVATINLTGLAAGVKEEDVHFTVTDMINSNASTVTKFTINKAKSQVNITINGKNVTATVTPGATGNVTFYVDGVKQVIELTNGAATWENALMYGNNTVVVVYEGDVNYTESENNTNYYVEKLASLVNVTAESIVYGKDAIITVTVPTNQTGYVTIVLGDIEDTHELHNGQAIFTISGLTVGEYNVTAIYLGDANYNQNTNKTSFNVTEATLQSSVIAENVTVLQNATFLISHITDNFTGKVNITVDGVTYTRDADSLIQIPQLTSGLKEATIVFWNDTNYEDLTLTVDFTVSRIPTTVAVTVEDVTYPGIAKAIVNVSGKANGTVIITIDGRDFTGTVVDGVASVDLDGLAAGVKEEDVHFTVTDLINSNASTVTKFTINRAKSQVNITITGKNVTATVTPGATGNVTFYVDGVKQVIVLNNSTATWTDALQYGNNTVVVVYEGDVNYTESENNTNTYLDKLTSTVNVSVDNITYGMDAVITVTVPTNQTGFVTILVNGIEDTHELHNGQAVFTITGLTVNEYDVNVTYLGDSSYDVAVNSTRFNVGKADLPASVVSENITVIQNTEFIIIVPGDYKGRVNITVDGIHYSTDVKSLITVGTLAAGNKTATVSFYDDANYKDLVLNTSFTVSELPIHVNMSTVNVDNMTRGYNSQFDYQAAFLDSEGNALANTDVEFKVNGKTYKVKTNKDGIAHLTESKLDVGVYNVTSVNLATGEEATAQLTIVARIIENKDLTMDFSSGKYFTVKVIGDDGNIAPEGEIIDIYANNIHYVAKVNKNGYAKLKINLNPKTYKLVAEYKTYKTTNKLVVKQVLKLVKKTVSAKKGKKVVLKAKLKWSNGKPIKGKKIVFKFKGKKYKAKTNSKGVAKVTIKAKVTKKLKKGKKYTYSASYKTNKVKGKIKVKK